MGSAVQTLPAGIPYTNDDGQVGVLSGKMELIKLPQTVVSSWVQRVHPLRDLWACEEVKQRASYLADKRHLAPFLVPHRFEFHTGKSPASLERAKLAYGIGLNKAYLFEILGHVRGTLAHYTWGALGGPKDENIITPPTGGQAAVLWNDCTGDGISWKNFHEGRVLEWILSSLGGFILIDSNRPAGITGLTQAMAESLGIRARLRWIPMSWVEDFSRGDNGYTWIKLGETIDVRRPNMPGNDSGYYRRHVLYELMDDGKTLITRYDDQGNQIGAATVQEIRDTHGRGILPLVEANFGEFPDIPFLGSGLLVGLDDIVIDLFNLLTEIREAYRDAAFGFLTYKGPDFAAAHQQMKDGTRLVNVGDDPNASLDRVAAEPGEVGAGLSLLDVGLKNWALSAKRRAIEVMEAQTSRSGVSLKAEFQLDLRPLLVAICEQLDHIESNVMFVLAQVEGLSVDEADQMEVHRETEFQLEQEASRIARICGEFLQAIPAMPQSLLAKMIERWASSIDFLKLDEPAGDGAGKTLRDAIATESEDIASAQQDSYVAKSNYMADMAAAGTLTGPNATGAPPGGQGGRPSPNPNPGSAP